MKHWFKWKTFWAAIAAITAAAAAYSSGEIQLFQFLQIIMASLLTLFVRAGIAKL